MAGREPGGIVGLYVLLEQHGRAVEADLQRYYRADLRDLCRPQGGASGLTWRRLASLIEWLPADAAVRRAAGGGWLLTDYLLADVFDSLQVANHLFLAAHVPATKLPRPPRPRWRPGQENRSTSTLAPAEKVGRLLEFRQRRQAERQTQGVSTDGS